LPSFSFRSSEVFGYITGNPITLARFTPQLAFYLKNEIKVYVAWRVEILNETVAAEIAALPADTQARFLRLAERIARWGWKA
jgi:hypothetical protein